MKKGLWCAGIASLCLCANLMGQESDSLKQYELDQVVITGTRLPLEKGRVPASITVVDGEVIENQNQSNVLSVLNSRVPGMFINERSMIGYGVGPQSGGGISIRGLSSSGDPANTRVLVLIDGQPQFMGVFGHPIHDSYFSNNIERVEVIRGPASILYGSNAMGGVINMITRQQDREGLSLGAKVAYGSFDTYETNASIGYKKDRFDIAAVFNRAGTGGHREDGRDDFKTIGGFLKTGYRLSDSFKASVDANIADSRFYDPGTVTENFQDHYFDFMRGRVALSLENTLNDMEGALRLFYNFGEHDFFDSFHSSDFNRGVTFYQNLKLLPDNVITVGGDYKNYGGKAETPAPIPRNNIDESVNETDVYGLIKHTLFDDLDLNIGLRYVMNSVYGNIVVPQYGAAYAISQDSRLKASASKGFRSPTLANLFFAVPANEELMPEEMWSYELSYLQELLDDRLSFELTGFLNKGENLIRTIAQGGPPRNINTGEFEHKGIEVQAACQVHAGFNLSANYTFLDMADPLPAAPRNQFNLHAGYIIQKLNLMVGIRQISDLVQGAVGNIPVDYTLPHESYTLLNIQAQYPFLEKLTVYGQINNILDEEYMIDAGYPMPGRNFMAGLKFRW